MDVGEISDHYHQHECHLTAFVLSLVLIIYPHVHLSSSGAVLENFTNNPHHQTL